MSITLLKLPFDIQIHVSTYLRAYDLTSLQLSCRFYANPDLTNAIVTHTAEHIYPAAWTDQFRKDQKTTPERYTLYHLRNMELYLVARVLSLPEPKAGGFYVSKSWCKTALRWLEVQQEQKAPSKKKLSKKQQRLRQRRLSDALPPWPNVNSDILCVHKNLQHCTNSKAARARRKLLDKQAWKILKKLYPDSTQLESVQGECLQCVCEYETARRNEENKAEKQKLERKKPLACPIVRGFYTRARGVPTQSSLSEEQLLQTGIHIMCPLIPGIYHVVPRAWCHAWRRYIKTGEGSCPLTPPDSSVLLCDAHRIPLIPPHLEAFLSGETRQLLASTAAVTTPTAEEHGGTNIHQLVPVGQNPPEPDAETVQQLRAAGALGADVASQQLAMLSWERRNQQVTGEQLDRENSVVVEIITEEEYCALEKLWDRHSGFSLRFSVDDRGNVMYSTPPCRECDASGLMACCELSVKNRATQKKKKMKKKMGGETPRPAAKLDF